MALEFMYKKLSTFIPRVIISSVSQLIKQGGFKRITPRAYVGFTLFFAFSLSLISFFTVQFYTQDASISAGIPISVFFLCIALFYFLLLATADARANEIEQVLPHALQIISSNIKAGMTLENAVWGAALPEFGAFREEIQLVSADSFGGVPIIVALQRLTNRVRSPILARAVKLIVEGISLGGEMSSLLENVAHDIRALQKLKQEIITSTTTYSIFIVFAAIIISPVLFSVSVFYAEMNENVFQKKMSSSNVDQSMAQQAGFVNVPLIGFSSGALTGLNGMEKLFALASIIVTALSAAFILSLIQSGALVKGVFYAPLFLLVSIAMFFLTSSVLRVFLLPAFT